MYSLIYFYKQLKFFAQDNFIAFADNHTDIDLYPYHKRLIRDKATRSATFAVVVVLARCRIGTCSLPPSGYRSRLRTRRL